MIIVLGVDPGLRDTGYTIIQGDRRGCRATHLGVFRSTGPDLPGRLQELYRRVDALIKETSPVVLVLEDVFAHHLFPRTALQLAHLRGVVCLAAVQAGVDVETMSPAEVKRAMTGSGRASKRQVQAMVTRLLALPKHPGEHAGDAAALALTGLSRRGATLRPVGEPVEAFP